MNDEPVKQVIWVGSSLENLKSFPDAVKDSAGYALHLIQQGKTPKSAKPLKGFKPKVMEIVTDYNTDTYRSIYSVKIDDLVYVLHCFQKKSKTGIKTPKNELELIKQRLKEAEILSKEMRGNL